MTFASSVDRRADLDPNGPAMSDGTRSLTNAGLLEHVRAARRHLHELGVGAGDVVALKLRNRVEFVVLLFACWRLGATVASVNPSLTDAEVVLQLRPPALGCCREDGVAAGGSRRWPSGISTRTDRVGTGHRWWIRRRWRS
jgi:acyl-CoA synthetase (AMP-forming)/AMP-acid ligase II